MTLNLESFSDDSQKKKSKTKYKAALGVGSVVSLFGIGSTLAANISLNGGGNVEFGQGVATTAACDEDGFTITPVTSYYNNVGAFKVDQVQISGINLTPQGTGYASAGYGTQNEAIAAHPGEYWDGATWVRTCDGVVLDFKAYTDDTNYLARTSYEYGATSASLSNPVGWYQWDGDDTYNLSPGFAIILDTNESGLADSNYASDSVTGDINNSYGGPWDFDWSYNGDINTDNSSFYFYVQDNNAKTLAGSISKITVQSMANFPSDYYAWNSGLGNPTMWD
jgi:hypothetical protein